MREQGKSARVRKDESLRKGERRGRSEGEQLRETCMCMYGGGWLNREDGADNGWGCREGRAWSLQQ